MAPVDPWGATPSVPPLKSSDPWASDSTPAPDPWSSTVARPKISNTGDLQGTSSALLLSAFPLIHLRTNYITITSCYCLQHGMFSSSLQSFTRVPSGSICLCVFMSVCLRFPLPGSFDLFNASNGTSKEDFSEFDSLRSSSSVLTGTHPCLCLCPHGVCVVSPSLSVISHLSHCVWNPLFSFFFFFRV